MKKNLVLAASLLLVSGLVMMPAVQAKKHHPQQEYSVTDRQVALEKKITDAYEANQLTLKEADDLRGKLKKIKTQETEMKDKNGGKLSYADDNSLEKSLNKVSEKLHGKMLEKRVK